MLRVAIVPTLVFATFLTAANKPRENFDDPLKPFVENFKGRGALNDGSEPDSPADALKKLKLADGLAMQVAAHEPAVAQPLNLYFDERGRMWVTQYLQYPFPAGLKVVEYDKYLRAVYDKVHRRRPIISPEKTRSPSTRIRTVTVCLINTKPSSTA